MCKTKTSLLRLLGITNMITKGYDTRERNHNKVTRVVLKKHHLMKIDVSKLFIFV